MKVLIAGDTHAIDDAAIELCEAAVAYDVGEVWQCGDLGWWPRDKHGKRFIEILSEIEIPLYFADGNHEDHDRLTHDAPHEYEAADNIWYVPRGAIHEVERRRVLFYGGARSVDRQWRTPGISWFASELPNTKQLSRAKSVGAVDVVVAHDSPEWVDYGYGPDHLSPWPMIDLAVSRGFRETLSELADVTTPTYWFNGHHHQRVAASNDVTTVHTLDEWRPRSRWLLILDLDSMEVTDVERSY